MLDNGELIDRFRIYPCFVCSKEPTLFVVEYDCFLCPGCYTNLEELGADAAERLEKTLQHFDRHVNN